MKLGDWLSTNKKTLDFFARDIGVANASVVAKYVNGSRIPRPVVMDKIAKATDGKVTANDFFLARAA